MAYPMCRRAFEAETYHKKDTIVFLRGEMLKGKVTPINSNIIYSHPCLLNVLGRSLGVAGSPTGIQLSSFCQATQIRTQLYLLRSVMIHQIPNLICLSILAFFFFFFFFFFLSFLFFF